MDSAEMWRAIRAERAWTADALQSLRPDQWRAPTLCAGWTVRELAGHLGYGPRARLGDVLVQAVRAGGGFDRMIDATARREAAKPPAELVEGLRAAVGSRRLAPSQTIRNALLDILVHAQDLAIPLGLDHPMPVHAARVAADDAWRHRFPFHARRRLHGLHLEATDVSWTAGAGAKVEGPIFALLLLLTGRYAALDLLAGPGLRRLRDS
ncbi:maleylpyruvate isomerase family mycothiol-dependent enzyme [Actinomadura montaniterrae]|uniref:Maleylpyruvate isomerase family mycothiol-dependent enzyme n=1 Tax=Actinomadura montaniterrae TaxID=1803903 RepID=A0A6L3WA48_9ACTN|nr:maleylpyruvate isomerase family mycothiol-dependent enzyme [Actinomadura montaniterrae]KAB2390441.1 maleylpyruvate isomerase family mycothiol-dependent enzyme [Actinomadura montaniterrae]